MIGQDTYHTYRLDSPSFDGIRDFFDYIRCYNRIMNAYIEYVILDNFVITYALATLSYRMVLCRPARCRAALAATIGTAVAVVYPFVRSHSLLYVIKVALWVVLSLILFLKKNNFIRGSVAFLALTFIFGGILFAVFYFATGDIDSAMRANAFDFPLALPIFGGFLCYFVARKALVKLNKTRDLGGVIYDFSLKLLGKTLNGRGLLDTGNRLYDPHSGLPVVVLGAKTLVKSLSDEQLKSLVCNKGESLQVGAKYMDIGTVGGGKNRILLLKPDAFILYSKGGTNILYDVVIGVSFTPVRDAIEYDAILPPALA